MLFLLLIFSCESADDVDLTAPDAVLEKSTTLFEGDILEKERTQENGIDVWEVKIKNGHGSIVIFYYTVNGQNLVEIEGKEGPFDYNIAPGNNLINLTTALTLAKTVVKDDNILKWELKEDEDFIDNWIYSVELEQESKSNVVYIDATNGDILQID